MEPIYQLFLAAFGIGSVFLLIGYVVISRDNKRFVILWDQINAFEKKAKELSKDELPTLKKEIFKFWQDNHVGGNKLTAIVAYINGRLSKLP